MKKKIYALVMAVAMLAMMLTGCIQNDIGVKMNKDGSGSISATIGIEKNFYENLKQLGSDPFEGKTTIEYTYEDSSYVAYTEVKEYDSYKEMEKALLDKTYDTELIEIAQNAQDEELNEYEDEDITEIEPEEILDITINGEKTEISTKVDDVNTEISEADNHIFFRSKYCEE